MIDATTLPEFGPGWLDADDSDSDIVLSTRVRLARNLMGNRFAARADNLEREEILVSVRRALGRTTSMGDCTVLTISDLSPLIRQVLLERHLVSRDLIGAGRMELPSYAALMLAPGASLGVMVNEEDHLRLQCLVGGFRLREAWRQVDRLDDELSAHLKYAFHTEYGYLTTCPTNVGTGLRASVLMHLPGLVLSQEIGKVLQGITQMGLTFRGLYGEGSEVMGNLFQISNQTTLGHSEEDLIGNLQKTVQQVVEFENISRTVLMRESREEMEDKVWRAYGLLRHARLTSFEEAMLLLSSLRLGVALKLLPGLRVYTLNQIMIFSQSAHLAQMAGKSLSGVEEDSCRASYIRRLLSQNALDDGTD
jgi:protein arginine kinase